MAPGPVFGLVQCQDNQGCHQGKSLKMPDESVGPQVEQSASRDEKQKIETLPLDDQENAQEQNVFQKVKTAFQTVSNAESEEEVVNYDGHIKEAKEFGAKELECEGLKAMVAEGVEQLIDNGEVMSSLCEITNKVKAIAPFAKADEVAIGIEPFGQLDVEVQRSQTMTQGKTGQRIDGGGVRASPTKIMNDPRAMTPSAKAEDDAIGTKQFGSVAEVQKLQTMMQGENGQSIYYEEMSTCNKETMTDTEVEAHELAKAAEVAKENEEHGVRKLETEESRTMVQERAEQGSMNAATMFALCAKKEGMGKRHNEPNSLPLTTVDSYTKFQEYMKTLENKGPESLPEKFANGAVVGKLQKGTKDVSELKQVQVEQHSIRMTLQPELKDGSIPVATVSRIASDTETEIIRRLMMEGQNKDQEIENLKCQKEVLEKDNKDMHDKRIDGGGVRASPTKIMNDPRAMTPSAKAEDDAIGTKQFGSVAEVQKLQTMMQGENGQSIYYEEMSTCNKETMTDTEAEAHELAKAAEVTKENDEHGVRKLETEESRTMVQERAEQGSMNAATMFALCAKKEGMGKRHNEPNSLPLTTVDSYTKFQEYMKTLENKGPESLPEKFANGAVVGKLQKGTKDVSELKQVQVEQHSIRMTLQPELKDGSIPVATVSRIASDTETEIIRRLMMEGQNKDQEIENLKCQKEVLEKDNKDMHDKLTKAISVQEQNQKLKDQVRIKNKTIKDFKEKEKESQRKLHQLQSENQSLNQKLHENSQITESAKQENENLKTDNQWLKAELCRMKDDLMKNTEELLAKDRELEEKTEQAKEMIQSLGLQIQAKNQTINCFKKKIKENQKKVQDLEKKQGELSRTLNEKLNNLRISKETYEDKTKELVAVERELRKEKIQQLEWAVDAELEPEGSLDYSDNCLRKQPTENLFYLREITMDDNANLCIKKDQVYISYLNEENQNLKLEVQAKNQNLKDVEREKEMLRREHDAMLQTINEVGQLSRKVKKERDKAKAKIRKRREKIREAYDKIVQDLKGTKNSELKEELKALQGKTVVTEVDLQQLFQEVKKLHIKINALNNAN